MKIAKLKPAIIYAIMYAVMIVLMISSQSSAVYVDLSDNHIVEAINFGINNAEADDYEFLSPWIVQMGKDKGEALLNSEFIMLAYESKKAANAGIELTDIEISDILSRTRGRLVFSTTLYGRGRNFAKDNEAIILVNRDGEEEEFISSFWENGDGQRVSGKLYEAECSYWFPAKDILPSDTVTLLITSVLGEEWEFTFDLALIK